MTDSGRMADKDPEIGGTPGNASWLDLYETHHEWVRRYFARRVANRHDVEDLVQTVFANLIGHRGRMKHPDALVRAVARHVLFRYWRRERRDVRLGRVPLEIDDGSLIDVIFCDCGWNPVELLLRMETTRTVESMLAGLTPLLAEALKLRFLHGLAIREAAARAGCSRDTLKKRLSRARRSIVELNS